MDKNNFYQNKLNGVDGFNPYCKTCTKEKSAKWVKDNAETHRDYKRSEKAKESSRATKRKNDQKYRDGETHQEWVNNNKHKFKTYRENRQNKAHEITNEEWSICKEYFDDSCAYCGLHEKDHFQKRKHKLIKSDLHKEHVDHNGSNNLSNCVPSCLHCNSSKWIHDVDVWYLKQPFYQEERFLKINKWLEDDHKRHRENRKKERLNED
jgi:hypothetical protein